MSDDGNWLDDLVHAHERGERADDAQGSTPPPPWLRTSRPTSGDAAPSGPSSPGDGVAAGGRADGPRGAGPGTIAPDAPTVGPTAEADPAPATVVEREHGPGVERGVARPPPEADPEVTIVATDVHVHYRHNVSQLHRVRSLLSERRRVDGVVHAVRGVSVTAYRGDSIGLLGRNGAGKSTLLRAMAGLLPVSSGEVHAIAAPIRLGVGEALQPTLPARDNIILGGLAMGLSRREIRARVDDIIEFAGIGAAAERPLATYSSGMRARIHFAIATAVEPHILMVDEALAVGDAEFKRRSRQRLLELVDRAATVIVVSHHLPTIRTLCNRAVWLEEGSVVMAGDVDEVADAFQETMGDEDDED